MTGEEIAQALDGKIGVDNTHHRTDQEEQEQDFQGVVNEEIQSLAQARSLCKTENAENELFGAI